MYSEVSTLWPPTIMKPDLGSRVQVSGLGVGKGIWGFEVWRVWGRFMVFWLSVLLRVRSRRFFNMPTLGAKLFSLSPVLMYRGALQASGTVLLEASGPGCSQNTTRRLMIQGLAFLLWGLGLGV